MEALVAVAIVIGVLGVILPVLPGLLLVALAVGWWALAHDAWWLLIFVIVVSGAAMVLKYLIPARTARDAASTAALAVGAAAALVGFFVIPVVGMFLGFLAGVLATEVVRRKDPTLALAATWSTAKGIGISIGVELVAAIAIAGAWTTALVVT